MSYDQLRHLADSWGLVMMAVLFITFVGWTFRPGSARRLDEAANLIFKDGVDEKAD
jgi:cytochrome c oxidase cbb3-type subunit 4